MIADEIVGGGKSEELAALAALRRVAGEVFPDHAWHLRNGNEDWTADNKASLWAYELRQPDRDLWGEHGGQAAYEAWLGDVHFLHLSVTSKHLFGDRAVRDNAGWRLSYMALPAPKVFVVGLAHHYQGTPAQNKLAAASNTMYDVLAHQLQKAEPPTDLTLFGRKVKAADWDVAGLTPPNLTPIGADPPVGGVPLRWARNTTTKKILSTFITIRAIPQTATDGELELDMKRFRELMTNMVAQE